MVDSLVKTINILANESLSGPVSNENIGDYNHRLGKIEGLNTALTRAHQLVHDCQQTVERHKIQEENTDDEI